ncbi:MAG: hypothetical protein Q3977_05265, partial [Oscillospiraceae bacterium]|nr:hypothetical protein [Oscillospiraceae bacterium]
KVLAENNNFFYEKIRRYFVRFWKFSPKFVSSGIETLQIDMCQNAKIAIYDRLRNKAVLSGISPSMVGEGFACVGFTAASMRKCAENSPTESLSSLPSGCRASICNFFFNYQSLTEITHKILSLPPPLFAETRSASHTCAGACSHIHRRRMSVHGNSVSERIADVLFCPKPNITHKI